MSLNKENGKFSRTEYEKFLIANNISAPEFEINLSKVEKKIYSKQKSFVNLNLFFQEGKIKPLKII